MTDKTHCLQDKTITSIELASDSKAMRFLIEGGEPIVAKADGDCCSSSWIEHVELPAMGFPAKVMAVESLNLPGSHGDTDDGDCLQVYGMKISTDKGDIVIDYRNSSNGYYGGSLEFPPELGGYDSFYGGVHGQNVSNEEWKSL
jgi:hypothetical protein